MNSPLPVLLECQTTILNQLKLILSKRKDIRYKPDNSPVSAADIYLENLIIDLFKNHYPGLSVIAEESFREDQVFKAQWSLIIDPIDGTENFISGLKEWGVSISLWERDRHAGSMLLMPELGEVLISGQKITCFTSRITGFSSSFHEAIADGIRTAGEYRVTGCAVYNLFNVITGRFSRFINPKGAYIWDLLPGIMLALEHGCIVLLNDVQFDGRLLDPTQKYRVDISNPRAKQQV